MHWPRQYSVSQQTVCIKSISYKSRTVIGFTELIVQPLVQQLRKLRLNCKQCSIYGVWLEPLEKSSTVSAVSRLDHTVEAAFAYNDPTQEICKAEMKQRNLTFFQQRHELAVGSVDADSGNGELLVMIPQELWPCVNSGKQFKLILEFSLEQPVAGLFFSVPKGEDGQPDYRASHCFTSVTGNSTRLWLPCVDAYSELCLWKLEITVPEDMVAIASGELLDTVYTADLQSKTFHFFLPQPTSAPNIGFAAGSLEILPDANASYITHFCPPNLLQPMQHTVGKVNEMLEFYKSLLGCKLPYDSLKIVFIDSAYELATAYASLIIASVSLLHTPAIIEQAVETRRVLALAIAQQYFGCYIGMQTFSDAWLPVGLAAHAASRYYRRAFGHNEYVNFVSEQMTQVCQYESERHEIILDPSSVPDRQSLFCLRFPQTLPPDYWAAYRSKSLLVARILHHRLGEDVLMYVLNKLITLANSCQQPVDRASRTAFLLSTQSFIDFTFTLTGKNAQYIIDQWVTQPGHAQLAASFTFNKKRNLIVLELKNQSGGKGKQRYSGPVVVTLQEMDGPFSHTVKLEDSSVTCDIACHSKSRKNRKRKITLSNGAEVEEVDLSRLETDCSVLWLRVDPDMLLIRQVEVTQPEALWHLMLKLERCVASQLAACRTLCQPQYHSRDTWQALLEVVKDDKQYYRVRTQACYVLCIISGQLELIEPLLAVFLSLFGLKDRKSAAKVNNFSNLQRYFLIKEAPLCMSMLRNSQDACPNEVPEFILSLLRFNDNSKNAYSDDYYRAALIESLFRTITPSITAYSCNYLSNLPQAVASVLEEVSRHMNVEKLLPSYKLIVTVKCLRVFRKLQRCGYAPPDVDIFKSYASIGNFIDVRLAAMEAMVNHIRCARDVKSLSWLLDVIVCNAVEDPTVRLQAVAMLIYQPPFLRKKPNELDTPELVEKLWRLLNTELSSDSRLRCSVASLYHLLYGIRRPSCMPLPENFLVLNMRQGKAKIAKPKLIKPPAIDLAEEEEVGKEAEEEEEEDPDAGLDELDIGLEDDYEFAPDEPMLLTDEIDGQSNDTAVIGQEKQSITATAYSDWSSLRADAADDAAAAGAAKQEAMEEGEGREDDDDDDDDDGEDDLQLHSWDTLMS